MALAFGAEGYYTRTPAELRQCFEKALIQDQKPVLINVSINPVAQKKPQVNWSLHVAMQIVCVSYVEELLVDKDKIVTCISVVYQRYQLYHYTHLIWIDLSVFILIPKSILNRVGSIVVCNFQFTWYRNDATFWEKEVWAKWVVNSNYRSICIL